MENASKALIIAGAILVSILLISIGVLIIDAINPTVDEVGDLGTSTAVQTFNGKLINYEGEGKKVAEVKSLVSAVNSLKQGSHQVTTIWETGLSTVKLSSKSSYTIEFHYDGDGYIDQVRIYTDGKTAPAWK